MTFTSWAPGEPNNYYGGEDYVGIVMARFVQGLTGKWNDFTGNTWTSPTYGLIEVVPEPGSLSLLALGGVALSRRRRV